MQFNQPISFQPTEFTNCNQFQGFNSTTPFQFNGYPAIIGEGDVTSIICPDGSVQFIFVPTTQWWRSRQNINTGNFNSPYQNNWEAWFVRSIYNPVQSSMFSQPHPIPSSFRYPRASTSDCCLNLPAPDVPLKFHNHNCTSTSDIHYFMPKQHNWFEVPKKSAAVQVSDTLETNYVFPYGAICAKPCNCTSISPCSCAKKTQRKHNNQCMCVIENVSNSEMSLEESKLDLDIQKTGSNKTSRRRKKTKDKKYQCFTQTASDKCVTTYSDQATDYAPKTAQKKESISIYSNSDLCESRSCICSSGTELDS